MQFFLDMKPPTTTHQQQSVHVVGGKPHFFDPPALKAARAEFRRVLAPHRPSEPLTGPLRLVTKWCYEPKKNANPSYKITVPDTDNMVKLLKDTMTKLGYWIDDAQVASEITEKFWARPEGIFIQIISLDTKPQDVL